MQCLCSKVLSEIYELKTIKKEKDVYRNVFIRETVKHNSCESCETNNYST